jgi:hypothetical protein
MLKKRSHHTSMPSSLSLLLICTVAIGMWVVAAWAQETTERQTFVGPYFATEKAKSGSTFYVNTMTIVVDVAAGEVRNLGSDYIDISKLIPCIDSSWYCLNDVGTFRFAIPKGWGGTPTTWKYLDMEYSVLATSGSDDGQAWISARPVNGKVKMPSLANIYLYDKHKGLVGFQREYSGNLPVFFSRLDGKLVVPRER